MITGIVPLCKDHDRTAFRCGDAALDDWFRSRADQDEKRNIARVFIAVDDLRGVVGFYTLSAYTLTTDELPAAMAKKLPRYDKIPAMLIGRLAGDLRCRGEGVGDLLLGNAIDRIVAANRTVAAHAVVVDAKDDAAFAFYHRVGFIKFPLHPRRLFLPMTNAEQTTAAAARTL